MEKNKSGGGLGKWPNILAAVITRLDQDIRRVSRYTVQRRSADLERVVLGHTLPYGCVIFDPQRQACAGRYGCVGRGGTGSIRWRLRRQV